MNTLMLNIGWIEGRFGANCDPLFGVSISVLVRGVRASIMSSYLSFVLVLCAFDSEPE